MAIFFFFVLRLLRTIATAWSELFMTGNQISIHVRWCGQSFFFCTWVYACYRISVFYLQMKQKTEEEIGSWSRLDWSINGLQDSKSKWNFGIKTRCGKGAHFHWNHTGTSENILVCILVYYWSHDIWINQEEFFLERQTLYKEGMILVNHKPFTPVL